MKFAPLVLVVALLAAGCGTGDDTAEPATTTGAPATTAVPASTTSTTAAPATTAAPEATTTTILDARAMDPAVRAEIERVAGTDEDGPFYMVNLIDFADVADYPDDSPWAGSTGLEANARYSEVSGPALAAVGAEPVFVGRVERSLIPGEDEWDIVAIVHYPSRQALVELDSNAEFVDSLVHKHASLANTFALMTDQIDLAALPPVDPATVPYPATDDDPPFMMVHIIDYHETAQYQPGDEPDDAPISGRDAVERYSANAGAVAAPLGVRGDAWFSVFDTALGDHDRWEEVRLNSFPSGATFQALTSDPTWAEGTFHRSAGIAETYALMTAPLVVNLD